MDALEKDDFQPCKKWGGYGEALVGDEWHPPKLSLFQNGFKAKRPPF